MITQRDIKYRIWNTVTKEMYPGIELERLAVRLTNPFNNSAGFEAIKFHADNLVWMQWTGVKDVDGNEIYEGDIAVVDGRRAVVVWLEDEAAFRYRTEFDPNHYYVMNWNGNEKVIGNIYRDPELIKR